MNDFTKEELIIVAINLCCNDEKTAELLNKINLMIENYCEHDWQIGFGSIHSPVIYCNKCFCQKPMVSNEIFNKLMETNK